MSFGGCAVTVESQIGIVCFNSAAGEVCALTAHIPLEFKALQTRGWFICHYKKPGRCVPLQQCHDASTITVIRLLGCPVTLLPTNVVGDSYMLGAPNRGQD
jgi:hypothetical protein